MSTKKQKKLSGSGDSAASFGNSPSAEKHLLSRRNVLLSVLMLVLLSGNSIYFWILPYESDDSRITRYIDITGSKTKIRSGADDYLTKVFSGTADNSKSYQSDNTNIALVQHNGQYFVNMVSLKMNWEGVHYLAEFEEGEILYELTFKFNELENKNLTQRFGCYVLANPDANILLGCRFVKGINNDIAFNLIENNLSQSIDGVSLSTILDTRVYRGNPDELHRLNIHINKTGVSFLFNDSLGFLCPVSENIKTLKSVLYPFIVNGNIMFRIDNVTINGKAASRIFHQVIQNLNVSNSRKFHQEYTNEDFQFTPPYDRYVYKLPVMNDYRNALVGLTPFVIEYPLEKVPSSPVLRFGYGVLDQSRASGVPVRFRIALKNQAGITPIFDEVIKPDRIPEHNEWRDKLIELDNIRKDFTHIEFRAESTNPDQTGAFAGWVNPVVFPKGYMKNSPNVLLISLDTVRWDRLSCMGYNRQTTLNIDVMGNEGAVFTQCISQASWTTPSHLSIMTSQYPSVHGVNQPITERFRKLDPHKITLAELLRNKGYETIAFTGHSAGIYGRFGLFQGFNQYRENGDLFKSPFDIEIIVPRVISWLKKFGQARPFFMFLHTFETHLPFTNKFYAGDSVDITSYDQYRANISDLYDGDLRFTDSHLGKLFEKLRELELLDNTIVIITSDHGYVMPGEHGKYDGYSNNLYEGCVRVPLIMRYPDKIPGRGKITSQVRLIDIGPTILDILGYENFPEFQGVSLLPLIQGKPIEPILAFAEALNRGPERKMVRTEIFKYIYIPEMIQEKIADLTKNGIQVEQRELYHLTDDPWEKQNIYEEKQEVMADYQQLVDNFIIAGQSKGNSTGNTFQLDAQMIQKLRGLGYIK